MSRLRRFAGREDGTATLEFVLMFPLFIMFFLSTFELGMALARQMMMDRAVDLAVRSVRIGLVPTVTSDALRDLICENALMPNCVADLRLEMIEVDPRAWRAPEPVPDCVDRADPARAARNFDPAVQNQLMVLRVCAVFDPYFPTTGLGARLQEGRGGTYALVSSSAFVVEPSS